jgi:hypothetical protein
MIFCLYYLLRLLTLLFHQFHSNATNISSAIFTITVVVSTNECYFQGCADSVVIKYAGSVVQW